MELLNRLDSAITFRRADRMRGSGHLNGALEHLFNANEKREKLEYERLIVDLLLQASSASDYNKPSKPIQYTAKKCTLQIADGTIPEISAAEFSADVLREAISHTGYLIVRGLFHTADADTIRNCVDEALNARADSEEKTLAHDSPWYYLSPHFPGAHAAYSRRNSEKKFSRTGSFKVIDSPRGACRVLQIYRKYRLKEVFDAFFGEQSVIATRKWVFRLVEPIKDYGGGIGGGWHQDGQFMGEGIRALNMWIPLTDCGEGTPAPGITLIPKRIGEIVEYGTRGAKLDWVVGGELVAELAKGVHIISPNFSAGDALFFDHYSLHRSGHEIGQSKNRYALESWFYAKSAHAANSVIPYF
jgi:hypothetical protein